MTNNDKITLIVNLSSDEMLAVTTNLARADLSNRIEIARVQRCRDVFVVLRAIASIRPQFLVTNYDGSIGTTNYLLFGVFFLFLQWFTDCRIFYVAWSKTLRPFAFAFPFAPFNFLCNAPKVVAVYWRCLVQRVPDDCRVKGFNRAFAPIAFWYEALGLRLLRFGSWGYAFQGHFGYSNREAFYNHWLTYGLLYNRIGYRAYTVLSWLLFLVMASILASNQGVIYALPLVLVLMLSPYCLRSFLTFAKPENIGWPLALAALWCQQQMHPVLLSAVLLFLGYISFTVLFLTLPLIVILAFATAHYDLILAAIPVILKLAVDAVPVFQSGWHRKLLGIISGKGEKKDDRAFLHRKVTSGIYKWPNYVLLLLLLLLLTLYQALLASGWSWLVPLLYALLLLANFQISRFADEHTFYRVYLVVVVYCYSTQASFSSAAVCLAFLVIHSSWSDDQHINKNGEPFPADAPVCWSDEMQIACENFLSGCAPNTRILLEYTGAVCNSYLRNTLSVLDRQAIEKSCDFLPGEFTGYLTPYWLFDHSCLLQPEQSAVAITQMLQSAGIQYCAVFSEALLNALLADGYQVVGVLPLGVLAPFVSDDLSRINSQTLHLLQIPVSCPIIATVDGRSCSYRLSPNSIVIDGVSKGETIVVRYSYHLLWKATQGGWPLPVAQYNIDGLNFMQVCSNGEGDIIFRYGSICWMIR